MQKLIKFIEENQNPDAKYPETLKAVTEKVDAYVALANGDLTTPVILTLLKMQKLQST